MSRWRRTIQTPVLVAAWLLAGPPAAWPETRGTPPPKHPSFDRDIRPLLSDKCFACHGPDAAARQAELRLDIDDLATRRLDDGLRAIVPHDAAASALIERVSADDPAVVMPPPEAKLGRLTADEIDLLRRWIDAGAAYEPHWAFVPPSRPAPGDETAAVDAAIAAGLARRGLVLQPEADRHTLARRAAFDVTGLPPTAAQIREFVADGSPDAFGRYLDGLFASPRYGERMAADWLDIARYSDSYGFQVDRPRPTMWPWRDWVIRAFNDNLPWDQFVTWQVAGDLLPAATDEQILATAFSRLHQQECEGGSVEEEYRVNAVNDRVTTFGTAFLGLTLECCRCHDHKFDPLSQREFYGLFAFFDDIDEAGLYSYFTQATPTPKLRLADEVGAGGLARAHDAVTAAEQDLARCESAVRGEVAAWVADGGAMPAALMAATTTIPGELVRYAFDDRDAEGRFPDTAGGERPATSAPENTLVEGRTGRAVRLTGDHPVGTPIGDFRRSHPFTVSLWVKSPDPKPRAVVFHRSTAWTDAASRGYELLLDDGRLRWSLVHFWPGDAASVRTADPLPVGAWVHVAVTSDGSGQAAGLRIFVDGRQSTTDVVRDCLTREILEDDGADVDAARRTIRIGERMRDHGFTGGLVDDFRVFDRRLSALEIRELAEPGALAAALAAAADGPLLEDHATTACDPRTDAARRKLEQARRERDELAERPLEIMVMRDLPEPKTAYVLGRGEYGQRTSPVEPGTPAVLPPYPADQPRNRLGLARWLVHPDHPLLARVTVNRVWQALFGIGLVPSAEDLGSQATRPEYPDVLDLLAWKFSHPVAAGGFGWDMKRLVKAIMMTRTYRQRSAADASTMADDPLNHWLARGPRHRLPAEMIRDGVLAACGLLVERIGGPPVKTYDLPESFKPEAADTGDSLYRRSLYTFWRRSGPGPVLESFDVPKRVVCVARRDTTNSPLHTLVLMNGPQFVEAARVLAERTLVTCAGRADLALEHAFEALTGRIPDTAERRILRDMHAAQLAWYVDHHDDAVKLVAIGERAPDPTLRAVDVAAAAGVINALINYDGSVVKR